MNSATPRDPTSCTALQPSPCSFNMSYNLTKKVTKTQFYLLKYTAKKSSSVPSCVKCNYP